MRQFLAAILFGLISLSSASAQDLSEPLTISSADAVEEAGVLDGKLVEFEGKAIGERIRRGEYAWLNHSDGNAALGVWLPVADIPAGLSFGTYRRTGDRVRVRGAFQRACPEHGGDLDIHAQEAAVTEKGTVTAHPVDSTRVIATIFFLALSACLLPLWKRSERLVKDNHPPVERVKMEKVKEAGRK